MGLLPCSGGTPSPQTPLGGLLLLSLLLGASVVEAGDPSPARLRKAIEPIVGRAELASAFWGIEVRSLASGRTLYALNATKGFRPASTLKLLTTAAALDAYGPDARIRTTLETAARLDGLGRILGDVYLVGRGDPNLSGRFSDGRATLAFEAMAEALVAAGVRRIEGRLIGYEGAFAGERRGSSWTWEDLAWGYGTEVSALSFADNLVEARLAPGERAGDPALLTLTPDAGCLNVVSSVTTSQARALTTGQAAEATGAEDQLTLLREPGSNDVRLTGRLPLGGEWKESLAVADPASCAAAVFSSLIESRGIRVVSGIATSRAALPSGARVLAAYEGQPMAQMIRVVNTESQNLHSEMLLRLVGLKLGGEGSVAAGHEAVRGVLKRLGVDDTGSALADGSGLARTNLLTPRGVVALLAAMDRHPHAAAFRDSLAVAGATGTLEKRLRGTPAEQRLVAKTGSLQLANALAGYVTTTRGERLAFAIFVNNQATRGREAVQAIDLVAALLAEAR
jgi:D-alanyl-D-alanine carboxypeptidase/D-alanyl-D-alanine-endopeptidase (penicillin-binding protein 4)